MSKRIFLSPPWMGGSERERVDEAFASGYIAPCGPMVDRFEREFAAFTGVPYACAVSSGTAALDLLFHELGVGKGDRVFCSDLTFVSSIAPAVQRGAEPVFIDCDEATWTMNPDLLAEALADAKKAGVLPKVVVAVDLYGQCCDYERIGAVCEKYAVPLIIDAAEALGAAYCDHSEVAMTRVKGEEDHSEVAMTRVKGEGDHSEVAMTRVKGEEDHSEVAMTRVKGEGDHSEVAMTRVKGEEDHSEVAMTRVKGEEDHSEVAMTRVKGEEDHSEVAMTRVKGEGDHSEVAMTRVKGEGDHSEVAMTRVKGEEDHSEVAMTRVKGEGDHSEVAMTRVKGEGDHPVVAMASVKTSEGRVRSAGNAGWAAIYSFNGNKTITTSGGGMVVSQDRGVIERARKRSQQAREAVVWYEHCELGYNYRMSNIVAAIGVGQLAYLEQIVAKKREIFGWYCELLEKNTGVRMMPEAGYGKCSRWLTVAEVLGPVSVCNEECARRARQGAGTKGCGEPSIPVMALIALLEEQNIESRPVWKPMHLQPVFKGARIYGGAVSERFFANGICLPSGAGLERNDVVRICDQVKRSIEGVD